MLYVLLGISVAMSFFAGIEYVLLMDSKKKFRNMKEKYETLIRNTKSSENRERIVKELEK